jgi:hypothetical protein
LLLQCICINVFYSRKSPVAIAALDGVVLQSVTIQTPPISNAPNVLSLSMFLSSFSFPLQITSKPKQREDKENA